MLVVAYSTISFPTVQAIAGHPGARILATSNTRHAIRVRCLVEVMR